MANKNLMSGHRGPLFRSQGSIIPWALYRPQIYLIIYIHPIFRPQEPHIEPQRVTIGSQGPLAGPKESFFGLLDSLQGHKGLD